MCRLKCLQSGGKHAVSFDFKVVCQVLLQILGYRCTVMQVVVLYEEHLVKLFLLLNLFRCFCGMSHVRLTAVDIADVAHDWCTDDDISNEEEQKHESGEYAVVPAICQSIPAEQLFTRRGHQ